MFEPDVAEALEGIRAGDRVVVLTWLHQAARDVLRVHPRGDAARPMRGVFATRAPVRPNPIGLHEVEVAAVDGAKILVHRLEAIDGTPVLDLKPVLTSEPGAPAQEGGADELAPLIGAWTLEGRLPGEGEATVRGRATFEWLDRRAFVVQRWTIERPEFPDGIAVLGPGPGGASAQHYFDSRGVARVYRTSLRDGMWRLWREGRDFWQRFAGTFSADGATIDGAWEKSPDGDVWEHDFDLTYRRDR